MGSNLGDSEATIVAGAERVASTPGIELLDLSSIYTSKPAIVTEQPLFKNAVMLVETTLSPWALLQALQAIEVDFGRVREGEGYIPYGPRTLDLDIIDIEGVVLSSPQLTLPHPQALRRAFVVTPLLEISPHHVLANHRAVNDNDVDSGELVFDVDETVTVKGEGSQTSGPPCLGEGEAPAADGGEPRSRGGCLSVCATPIGNLGDITLRVLETLKAADIIYCEDTRVTRKLASRYEIKTPLRRADAHRLPDLLPALIADLEQGKHLAYVSDAGMPGISDPGSLLVAAVRDAGFTVEVLPGASALTTALAASGIKPHSHYFGGFFPRKPGAGKRLLESLSRLDNTTLVFFESVYRTAKTLQLIAEVLPERHVVMARELTKLHEEILDGTAVELADTIAERIEKGGILKGEVTLLIAP